MANAINWFEIPATNFDRAVKFYSNILDIQMQTTLMGESNMGFFPGEQGSVGGAVVQGEGYEPCEKGTLVFLNGGEDLDNVLSKIEGAGGKVILPKTQITPEYGFFALFLDTEGNRMALHSMK